MGVGEVIVTGLSWIKNNRLCVFPDKLTTTDGKDRRRLVAAAMMERHAMDGSQPGREGEGRRRWGWGWE